MRSLGIVGILLILVQTGDRSEEHTSELQSQSNLVCRLLLEKKKNGIHSQPGTRPQHGRSLCGCPRGRDYDAPVLRPMVSQFEGRRSSPWATYDLHLQATRAC